MTKLESGRSMVEMLGVLAIIGVLSIGGIMGYRMAMNRYKANEILNAAAQVAVVADTTNMGQGTPAAITFSDVSDSATINDVTASGEKDSETADPVVTLSGDGLTSDIAQIISDVTGQSCTTTSCALTMQGGSF